MPLPMVIAYHLIWTGYGWWLPNDLRGSTSRWIASDLLKEIGELHFGRKRIQPARRDLLTFFDEAHPRLDHPVLTFSDAMLAVVARAFGSVIAAEKYTCYACVVMCDHVHLVIRKHKHDAEEMIRNLQRESHLALRDAGLVDLSHPVWGGSGWKVFLDHPDDIRRTVKYVRDNPLPFRMPVQEWDFVAPYDGWPLHPGHNPNSPYARRLRGQGGSRAN
jgi:REP element-mobilizing transposase RayT